MKKARKLVDPPEHFYEPWISFEGPYIRRRYRPEMRSIFRRLRRSGNFDGDPARLEREALRLWYDQFPIERLNRLGDTPGPKRVLMKNGIVVTDHMIHPAHEKSGRRSLTSFAQIARRSHPDTSGLSSGPRFRKEFLAKDPDGELIEGLTPEVWSEIHSPQRWKVSLTDWVRVFPDSTEDDLAELRQDQNRD